MFPYSLIAFDLDDTLVESKSFMTQEMGERLSKLLEISQVTVISGAKFEQFCKQLLPFLPIGTKLSNLHILPTQGTSYVKYEDNKWDYVYRDIIEEDKRKFIIEKLTAAVEKSGIEKPSQIFGEQIEDRESQITWSALGQEAPLDAKRVFDPNQDKRKIIVNLLRDELKDFDIKIGGLTSIDIIRGGVSKATGLQRLLDTLRLEKKNTLYIGDALFTDGNDESVKLAGFYTRSTKSAENTLSVIDGILESYKIYPKVFIEERPWGNFEQFTSGENVTVKIISVKENSELSLQYHHNRAELWRVIGGAGFAEVDGVTSDIKSGDSIFASIGAVHRIGTKDNSLKILEIAFGKFDENDIVRLEDNYGRAQIK